MELFEAIKNRRSIRNYKPDLVPAELVEKVITAGRWAPTGGNKQYWKFIAVTAPNVMKMVKSVSPMFWGEAPAAIFVCLDLTRSSMNEEARRGHGNLAGFPSQNIMLAAHALGLGTCAVGGFNKLAIKEVLDIPEDMDPLLLITVGYPNEEPPKKPRRPMSEVAFLNSCNNPWGDLDE